jgi:hypothetical protein
MDEMDALPLSNPWVVKQTLNHAVQYRDTAWNGTLILKTFGCLEYFTAHHGALIPVLHMFRFCMAGRCTEISA